MPEELYTGNMIDKLPTKIEGLIFGDEFESLITTISSAADLNEDQEILLYSYVTDLMIGKINLEKFKSRLFDLVLAEQTVQLIFNYLDQKLFSNIYNELIAVQKTYQRELRKANHLENNDSDIKSGNTNPSSTMISYIQELASTIKKTEEETVPEAVDTPLEPKTTQSTNTAIEPKEEVPSETVAEVPIILQEGSRGVSNDEAPLEPEGLVPPKESLILKMMTRQESQGGSKLNKYFKELKDSIDNKKEEKENVFQPPFKTARGKSIMIESSYDSLSKDSDSFVDAPSAKSQAPKDEIKSEPIKYNSFDYLKKPETPTAEDHGDEKFIDLGDF